MLVIEEVAKQYKPLILCIYYELTAKNIGLEESCLVLTLLLADLLWMLFKAHTRDHTFNL